jgi:hypothetical protein
MKNGQLWLADFQLARTIHHADTALCSNVDYFSSAHDVARRTGRNGQAAGQACGPPQRRE